jgi:hypothetical protein
MDCFAALAMTLIGRRVGKASACPPLEMALSMVGAALTADAALKPFDNHQFCQNIQY